MLKRILFLLVFLPVFSQAQVVEVEKTLKEQNTDTLDGWKTGGTVALNLSQISLTNWSAGGQNSISTNGLFSVFAHLKKGNGLWENYLDLGYGTIKQGKNAGWWKSDDKVDFTSKYGKKAGKAWYYAALLNFKTQMTAGYNYPDDSTIISNLMAPGYTLIAIGMDYKPKGPFTAFLAPLTGKITSVLDQNLADAGAFGVTAAEYDSTGQMITHGALHRAEFGGYIRMYFKKDIMKNVALDTKVDLFSNYLDHPGNIDVNWEMLLSMKVNKYISATFQANVIYDDDIDIAVDTNDDGVVDIYGPRTQFKEVFGIGFSYKF